MGSRTDGNVPTFVIGFFLSSLFVVTLSCIYCFIILFESNYAKIIREFSHNLNSGYVCKIAEMLIVTYIYFLRIHYKKERNEYISDLCKIKKQNV